MGDDYKPFGRRYWPKYKQVADLIFFLWPEERHSAGLIARESLTEVKRRESSQSV